MVEIVEKEDHFDYSLRIFTKDEMIYLILWMIGYGGTFFFFF